MDPDEGDRVKGSYVDRSLKSLEVQATPTASTTRRKNLVEPTAIPIAVEKRSTSIEASCSTLFRSLDASETVRSHIYDVLPGGMLHRDNRSCRSPDYPQSVLAKDLNQSSPDNNCPFHTGKTHARPRFIKTRPMQRNPPLPPTPTAPAD